MTNTRLGRRCQRWAQASRRMALRLDVTLRGARGEIMGPFSLVYVRKVIRKKSVGTP